MRVSFCFHSLEGFIFLPYNYNEFIQALIYEHLPENKSRKLHDLGFVYEKRRFKLFTFSRIQGRRLRRKSHNGIYFQSPITIIISSPVEWILHDFAEQMLRSAEIRLGRETLYMDSIEVFQPRQFDESVKIRLLSPMTIYSTLTKPDGKKLTHYYTPYDKEFSGLLSKNLQKKFALVHKRISSGMINITPLFTGNRERIVKFKGTIIKAWDGQYLLEGDPELIQISYETGLGSKNSQGFGMWEEVEDFRRKGAEVAEG